LVLPRNRFDRVSFDARFQARTALLFSSYGGFLVAQAAARRMLPHGSGTILLTGASASVKGYPQSVVSIHLELPE
jgi:NAD(P)-dependent dehydrogenase (short-subunit alcohol dehydrogenase family)